MNDTLLRTWNTIPPKRPDSLRAYLLRITRNLSIDRIRRNRAEKRGDGYDAPLEELAEVTAGGSTPEEEVLLEELTEALNRFLNTLSERDRRLVVRRYFLMEPYSALSRDSGLSEGHLRTILARSRKKLRAFLMKENLL